MTTPTRVIDLLPDATKAIQDIHRMLDKMLPLVVEITGILDDGQKQLAESRRKDRRRSRS